ncbi:hypothetical protein ZYGM_001687 [Zygosaccharomyces mellis]|uniref:Uncharacterized protein n=1 Tax=Zygosaccharomyces mellis TaxID=42258 RepID=A0A4C2EA66_9SACH|nr:hypothetical protein ZYGM_001687 [Zygosaccharomyces mellis]
MATVQEQVDARKRRLKQLSQLTNTNKRAPDAESSIQAVETAFPQIDSSQTVSESKKSSLSSDELRDYSYGGTEIMRNALKEPLDELNRRTNKEIQRLVRKKVISDAMNQE